MASLRTRLARFGRRRGESGRAFWMAIRRATRPRRVSARRQLARDIEAPPGLEIEPDRGFRVLAPDALGEAAEVAAFARERADQRGGGIPIPKKPVSVRIVGTQELTRESPLMRLALRRDLIKAVADYLGVVPILYDAAVLVAPSVASGARQRILCDPEDTRQVKAWVLCTEVGSDSRPLMVMDAERSKTVRRKTRYKYRGPLKETVARRLDDFELQELTGPPGTTCLADTSRCFYSEGLASEGGAPRVTAMLQFLTPSSFVLPRDFPGRAPFARLADPGDDELVRSVLGAA